MTKKDDSYSRIDKMWETKAQENAERRRLTKEDIEDSITYKLTGALMMAAGLLSDAQELLSMGASAQANEAINDAKRVIFMVMDGELDPGIRK